jgi:antitoxin (DNA-binding transcriptional repressor) of toxin-antitoxin stability system
MKNQIWILGAALALSLTAISASVAAPQKTRAPRTSDVIIVNTGDRLTPGYQATVAPDGTLTAVLIPYRSRKPIHRTDKMLAVTRQRFFADLAKAEPLNRLPTGAVPYGGRMGRRGGRGRQPMVRMAPITGPQVFIRYQGQQSPNLRQVQSAPGQVLYEDIKQILHILRLPIPNIP